MRDHCLVVVIVVIAVVQILGVVVMVVDAFTVILVAVMVVVMPITACVSVNCLIDDTMTNIPFVFYSTPQSTLPRYDVLPI